MAQQLGLAIMPPGLKFFNAEIFANQILGFEESVV